MKTKEQIKKWILKNCINPNGDIDISDLDFSDFKGNVYRGKWRVGGNLAQDKNEVKGVLWQNKNKVGSRLWQDDNNVEGDLYQHNNRVKGKTHTDFEYHNQVMKWNNKKGWVKDEAFKKSLENMNKEELIKKIRKMEK